MKPPLRLVLATVLALLPPLAAGADGAALVREQCSSCHALAAPGTAPGIEERAARKGPPLHYAGNKFQRDWLVAWLQAPTPLRPAGVFPPAAVRRTPDGDRIDPAKVPAHPKLPADQAEAAADYLMQLRPFDDRIAAQGYQPGSIAPSLAKMNFTKFKGCDACHRHAEDAGGVSGPELHTAWTRLQPGFIASFIADPVAWDANTLMPRAGLADPEVEKLADFLKLLSEGQP